MTSVASTAVVATMMPNSVGRPRKYDWQKTRQELNSLTPDQWLIFQKDTDFTCKTGNWATQLYNNFPHRLRIKINKETGTVAAQRRYPHQAL